MSDFITGILVTWRQPQQLTNAAHILRALLRLRLPDCETAFADSAHLSLFPDSDALSVEACLEEIARRGGDRLRLQALFLLLLMFDGRVRKQVMVHAQDGGLSKWQLTPAPCARVLALVYIPPPDAPMPTGMLQTACYDLLQRLELLGPGQRAAELAAFVQVQRNRWLHGEHLLLPSV